MTSSNQRLIEIGKKVSSSFEDHSIEFIETLIDGDGMRGLLEWVYFSLVSEKIITQIEDLPIDRKNKLWESAKDFLKVPMNKEKTIQFVRCLYCLEYYLN